MEKIVAVRFLKVGKFIVLGKTKRENTVHKARLRKIKLLSTEELKLNAFACYAKGNKRIDHAIGIDVDEMGVGLIIDNGCKVKPSHQHLFLLYDLLVCYL